MEYLRVSRRAPAAWLSAVFPSFQVTLLVAIHVTAAIIMLVSEQGIVEKLAFLLTWALLNCFFLVLLRRPITVGALSLLLIVSLIQLSRFKYEVIWMTINFLDLMIVDADTVSFLLGIFPNLGKILLGCFLVAIPLFVLMWRGDSYRVRRGLAACGVVASLLGLTTVSFTAPQEHWEEFLPGSHISKFVRSGVESLSEFWHRGYLESDAAASGHLGVIDDSCATTGKRPNIILIHDESSFDIRVVPGIKLPPDYGPHFKSFDGKQRRFMVESNGGASWFAEYNVLAGLSSRSYGRFSYFLTRVAAGRVERGLPRTLQRCGYHTYTLYPALGAFMSARSFHTSAGIEHFIDAKAMGAEGVEPDSFYYGKAAEILAQERGEPAFVFVYLAANHFPWEDRFQPELTPGWKDPGNEPKIDEYLRRQTMSARHYSDFLARLKRDFPMESFLIVRYGDHQPEFAAPLLEPGIGEEALAQRMATFDPRYFSTYYGIDVLNFKPSHMASALDKLDAPYLPLVIQQLAGLPLGPSFGEQKRIFERCAGVYYECKDGAESRRFNRLLIDAGFIKGL